MFIAKISIIRIWGILVCMAVFPFAHVYSQEHLSVGDAAPVLALQEWVKGKPFKEFKKGEMYLLDFGGTWCHSCRKSYPHLSQLARQYKGKINVVAVFCEITSEKKNDLGYIKVVKSYIKNLNPEFSVAVDVPEQTSLHNWVYSLKRGGVPSAFLINTDGRIAWIGDPLDADEVIPEVLTGRYTAESHEIREKQLTEYDACVNEIMTDIEARKMNVVSRVDSLIAIYPQKKSLWSMKFRALVQTGNAQAEDYLQELINKKMTGFDWTEIPWILYGWVKESPSHYELSLKAFNKVIEESETKWVAARVLSSRAEVHSLVKNYTAAIKDLEQAIRDSEGNIGYSDDVKKSYYTQLDRYKKEAAMK